MSATLVEPQQTTPIVLQLQEQKRRMKLDGSDGNFGDWRDDLVRDGFAVVKGAVPRERADKYADTMYSWLEDL